MKYLYTLTISAILCVPSLYGQVEISITPNPVVVEDIDVTLYEAVGYALVKNESDETKTFIWNRNVVSMPEEWESAVCDVNVCHTTATSNEVFELGPGQEGTLDVHVYPFGVEGGALIEVTVSEQGNWDNTITGEYYFGQVVSVAERHDEPIVLFPNPVTDLIFIDNADDVAYFELYDLNGNRVTQTTMNGTASVSVAHLPQGHYVARLLDNNGQQVSSNVVIKK